VTPVDLATAAHAALLARMKELRVRLRALEGPGAPSPAGDHGDQAVSAVTRDERFSGLDRIAVELGAIEAALRRLDEGTYGQCVDCDEAIPEARLRAIGWLAERDVRCQERHEFTEGRMHGRDRRPAPYPADEGC
jgi:DnaK suppressor protein